MAMRQLKWLWQILQWNSHSVHPAELFSLAEAYGLAEWLKPTIALVVAGTLGLR